MAGTTETSGTSHSPMLWELVRTAESSEISQVAIKISALDKMYSANLPCAWLT